MWAIIELLLVISAMIFVLTQMVLPPFLGLPNFWIFKKSTKIEHKKHAIDEVEEDLQAETLEQEYLRKKKLLEKRKKINSRS